MENVIRTIFFSILALILVFVMVQIGRTLFVSDSEEEIVVESPPLFIPDLADSPSAEARMTIQGEIRGKEEAYSVAISINNRQRVFEVIQGYDGQVVAREQFDNTVAGFDVFLRAIDFEGFSETRENLVGDDERGVCAQGKRTVFEFVNENETLQRTWATNCSRKDGTFAGDRNDVEDIFEAQIPEYKQLIKDIDL